MVVGPEKDGDTERLREIAKNNFWLNLVPTLMFIGLSGLKLNGIITNFKNRSLPNIMFFHFAIYMTTMMMTFPSIFIYEYEIICCTNSKTQGTDPTTNDNNDSNFSKFLRHLGAFEIGKTITYDFSDKENP